MKILFVSLRGPTNADRRGGAQDYIESIGARWVEQGHAVTIACSQEVIHGSSLPGNEQVRGIQVIRTGSPSSRVYPLVKLTRRISPDFDLIIENIMGFPIFLPQFLPSGTPLIAIKHHFEGKAFIKGQGPIKGSVGLALESVFQPLMYRNTPFVGVSIKTANEIRDKWITPLGPLEIVPPGIDLDPDSLPPYRSEKPLVLYFGAIDTGRKRVDHLIEAFRRVIQMVPDAELVIGGDGPDRARLEKEASGLPVRFLGFISEEQKHALLSSAWLFASPSMTEGFGITWVEANAYGLPLVGYDLDLDTVNESCSIMVDRNDIRGLSNAMLQLINDEELRATMSVSARDNARRFSWDTSSHTFMEFAKLISRKEVA